MLELLLAILTYMYGKHKACTDALRDYKLDMKMYVKSLQDPADVSHLRAWLVGGTVWDAVRKCKLPVFCADAWHYYDDTKYLILSLSMVLGWLAGQGLIHSFLFTGSWLVAVLFVLYLWIGWWFAGLIFALHYHHYLIDPAHRSSPNVRYFDVWFLIINSIKFWDPLPSQA